ncbi:hypothetical protein FKM82_025845 [Ascaphus truei]
MVALCASQSIAAAETEPLFIWKKVFSFCLIVLITWGSLRSESFSFHLYAELLKKDRERVSSTGAWSDQVIGPMLEWEDAWRTLLVPRK